MSSKMNFKLKSSLWLAAATAGVVLTGCGGGGGGTGGGADPAGPTASTTGSVVVNIANGPDFQATAGNSTQITATASTDQTVLGSMSWSAVSADPSAPGLVLGNADCLGATKNNVVYPANGQRASGYSNWTCALSLAASPKLTATTSYTITVAVKDDKGNSNTAKAKVTYVVVIAPPAPTPVPGSGPGGSTPGANGLLAGVGGEFSVQAGATAPLSCQATSGVGPYTYVWSVASNAGYPLALSSYASPQSSFVAPAVTSAVALLIQCTATDSSGAISTAPVKVNVLPPAPPAAVAPVVVFAGGNYVVKPGATAPLSCQATGGVAPYSYAWTVTNNANLPVQLSNFASAQSSFVAPSVQSSTALSFQCAATDAAKNTSVSSVTVTDSPTPVSALIADAGLGYTVFPGATGNLHCGAKGGVTSPGYIYQWSVTGNGALNVPLASYTVQDTTFTAPSVSAATTLSFQCMVIDSAGSSSTSSVSVTDTPTASTSSLVASAGKGLGVNPGQTVALDGSGTAWFDPSGASVLGPVIVYKWATSYPGVVINNSGAAVTTFVAPTSITAPTQIPFTLTTTSRANSSVASVTFLVDPYAPFSLVVSPPAQKVILGSVASMTAQASSTNPTPTLYYNWIYVSGPGAPTMGGQQTATMGFVAAQSGTYVFQVAVGYQPITASYPGVYFANTTVTVPVPVP